jgi:hypothetical protein
MNKEILRMQMLAGLVTEDEYNTKLKKPILTKKTELQFKFSLLLKIDNSIKYKIKSLISKMPKPKGENIMTPLPDDKIHITLTSIKNFKPYKDKFKDFKLSKDIKTPVIQLGKTKFVYRKKENKVTYVVEIQNQNDVKQFVDKIYKQIGEQNPNPNRFFHITIANNQNGDPFKSIGNITKDDFIL